MSLSIRPVVPASDAVLIHEWVTEPGAAFWGMGDKDLDEVGEIYAYIDDQEHLAAYLVCDNDLPLGLFQTYDPFVDEIGDYYDRQPGDLGFHMLLRDDPRRSGRTADIVVHILRWLFADPDRKRIVLEPDAANPRSHRLVMTLAPEIGPRVEMPTKTAQFYFVTRDLPAVAAVLPPRIRT